MPSKLTAIVLLGTLALGGCIFAPGGGDNWERGHTPADPTIGQELLDLDKALQAGVITGAEYESTKKRILNGR